MRKYHSLSLWYEPGMFLAYIIEERSCFRRSIDEHYMMSASCLCDVLCLENILEGQHACHAENQFCDSYFVCQVDKFFSFTNLIITLPNCVYQSNLT